MAENLVDVLMRRDNLSEADATKEVKEARRELHERLAYGEMPFDICEELFGLEPDYLLDLL
jgi:hypothetical protein